MRELMEGDGSYEFDYLAAGVRKGFEEYTPIVQKGLAPLEGEGGQQAASFSDAAINFRQAHDESLDTPSARNAAMAAPPSAADDAVLQLPSPQDSRTMAEGHAPESQV